MEKLSHDYIGITLSTGTLLESDLLPEFINFLSEIQEECNIRNEVDQILTDLTAMGYPFDNDPSADEWTDELITEILNWDIFNLLNEIAPENTYFGAHEGDGCRFGFWIYDNE